ncbi:hypothetical protein [Kitasatospora sp. NPDC050543]|uniref:hypothetical protein n=1 Tax=Kitasatospora sp. NPDC050543 TaxID=3364054 RepID=UPI0037A0FE9D
MNALDVLAGFGANGRIGPLYRGASLPEITAELGEPWDGGPIDGSNRWPHRFGYGSIDLTVCRCRRVSSMSADVWRESHEILDPGSNALIPVGSDLPLRRFTAALDSHGCRWRAEDQPAIGQIDVVTEPAGVVFVFVTRTHDTVFPQPLLANAAVWSAPHDCPPIPPGTPDGGFGT